MGRKRLKERVLNPTTLGVPTMNTLQLIKNKIDAASALHNAQIHVTKYRGVECQVHKVDGEKHGTFCYRGQSYVK